MSNRTTIAAACAAAVLAAGTGARAGTCHGVNGHQASNAALDLAAAAGNGFVRFDINWFQVEPAEGVTDFTEPDRFIAHASSLGLGVFVTIAYTPSWAVSVPCNDADPNPVNWCRNRPPASSA